MKRLFILSTIIFSFGLMHAQETYHFRTDASQGFSVENSTETNLSLHYAITELGITDIDNGVAKGHEIVMKGSFGSFAEGQPNLPFENRYIAVPRDATVSIKVKENGSQTLNSIDLLPAAAVQGNSAVGMPKTQKDMSVFGKDADFPSENVSIAQTTRIRGLDVVLLSVTPFRYNPVRKTLEVIYDMDIEISFEGGSGQFGEARYRNPAWDGILRDLVLNSDMLPEAHYYDMLNQAIQNREEGCEYLIISPDDEAILAYADTLREFRTKQGVLTKVVSVTECGGNDADAIKGYIKNAYDHWAVPPAAVMIFSGVDTLEVGSNIYWASSGIPGFGLVFKEYDNGYYLQDFQYSSDNPYGDMNDDSIPDIALSRLPATTLEEYHTQVNKLIQYETAPPTRTEYYDQPIITSSYENNKWFLITSQSVNKFYRDKLGKHPKNFYMVYDQMGEGLAPPDTAWSTGYNTDAVVNYFGPQGQNYIAQQPDTLRGWRDMIDYSYLIDALNQSSFLTLYRDHSSYDLWCSPWMYSDEVKNLTNADPTFIFSIGCDAALYSNVLYFELFLNEFSEHYWSMGEKPMIYEFCKAKVGALGGIGATSVTHSHFNDILTWGMIDNFWPNFMPDLGTMTQPEFTRPAYALVAGKLFLNQHAFLPNWWPQKVTTTQNVFHYLGETYLNLYTEVPQQMAIEAAPCTDGQSQYTITAEEGALICLSHGDDIINVTLATGQPQSIEFPNLPIGDHIFVTVTKQNRFRFEKMVSVVSSGLPFVYMETAEVNDQDGNGQLDYGEAANIHITLNNYRDIASTGGEITLHCDSPYINIEQDAAHYPQLGANATFKIWNAFRIRLSKDVPDQTTIQLKVRFNEGENTHEDDITLIANAPVVSLIPDYWTKTAEGEPSTHIATEGKSKITFTVTNKGHSNMALLSANLDIKAPFVEIENPQLQIESLAPNETYDFSYELNTTPNTVTGAWLQSQFTVQHLEQHFEFDTIIQYGGIFENFETDTLNPFFQWTNTGAHKWTYCTEDAFEGERCLISNADTSNQSVLKAKLKSQLIDHDAKVSFYYKTDPNESMLFYLRSFNESIVCSSPEWQYGEALFSSRDVWFNWYFIQNHFGSQQAKIDNICFPPKHTAIAYAGDDIMLCKEMPVELSHAYAYDCDSVRWATDGDGLFEDNTMANTVYHPGDQDLTNGQVSLTLLAFGGTSTISSTMTVNLLDEIDFDGIILGDSIVNKYEHQVSHYSIDPQDGIIYHWQLDPAEAGIIYSHDNEIDLVWNLQEGDMEVTLSVTAENGCNVEPVSKTISLIGYDLPEWPSLSFDLFPNPTDGKVNLVVGETLQGKAVVEVYNLLGERMMAKNVYHLQKGETMCLDLSSFVSGLYIIKLSTENGNCTKKVSVW